MKSIKFTVPGVPIGYKTTTKRSQHMSLPYKRYTIYKALVAICFLEALCSKCKHKLPKKFEAITRMYKKDVRTPLIKLLGETINKTDSWLTDPHGVTIWIKEISKSQD